MVITTRGNQLLSSTNIIEWEDKEKEAAGRPRTEGLELMIRKTDNKSYCASKKAEVFHLLQFVSLSLCLGRYLASLC